MKVKKLVIFILLLLNISSVFAIEKKLKEIKPEDLSVKGEHKLTPPAPRSMMYPSNKDMVFTSEGQPLGHLTFVKPSTGVRTNNWSIVGDFLKDKWEKLINNQIFSGVAVGSLFTSSLIGLIYYFKSTPIKIFYFLIGLITVKLEVNSISHYYYPFQLWVSQFNVKKLRSYQLTKSKTPDIVNLGTGLHIIFYKYRPLFIFKTIEYSNIVVEKVAVYMLGLKPKLLNIIIEEIKNKGERNDT